MMKDNVKVFSKKKNEEAKAIDGNCILEIKDKGKGRTHLTEIEVLTIENNRLTAEGLKKDIKIFNLTKREQMYVFDRKIEESMVKLGEVVNKAKEVESKLREEFGGSSDSFGYDPLTREVRK